MTKTQAELLIDQVEHQMDVQGYVRFSDIWKAMLLSRQRIDQLLQSAVEKGLITKKQLEEWKSSYMKNTLRTEFALEKGNKAWIESQSKELGLSTHDVINRVLRDHISHR
jgi:DNA-binding transcriptional regulator LsrR (DeoR family)